MIILNSVLPEKELIKKIKKLNDAVFVANEINSFLYYKFDSRIFRFSYEEILRALLSHKYISISSITHNSLILKNVEYTLNKHSNYFVENGILHKKYINDDGSVLINFSKKYINDDASISINFSKKDINDANSVLINSPKKKISDIDSVLINLIKEEKEGFIKILRDDQKKSGKLYKNKLIRRGYSLEEFDKFCNLISLKTVPNLKNLPNPEISDSKEIKEIKFNTRQGFVLITYNKEKKLTTAYAESINENNNISYYFNRGVVKNVFFNLRPEFVEKKMKRKNLLLALFGFSVFILFSSLTFIFVFDYNEMSEAFEILSTSFNTPWPYLFIFDYLLNTFGVLIIGMFVARAFLGKWNFKRAKNWFFASNFRWLIYQVTGFHFLAMASWFYFMRKTTSVRTASLVATMGSVTLVRFVLQFATGIIFVFYGTWYTSTLDWVSVGVADGESLQIVMLVFGVLGFCFWAIGGSYLILFVYSKRIQNFVFRYIIFLTTRTKKTINYFDRTEQIELRIQQLRVNSNARLKNREFMTRTVIFWVVFFVLDLFSTTYTINMFRPTDVNAIPGLNSPAPVVWDMWNLTSLQQLRRYSNEAIWLPGGMGMIEEFTTNANSAYMMTNFSPYFDSTDSTLAYIESAGVQSAFVERFFNYYLPFMTRLLMIGGAFIAIFYFKIIKKVKGTA